MLHMFSRFIVSKLNYCWLVPKEKEAVYVYGVELICSTGLSFLSMLLISIFSEKIYCFISFLAVFFVLRMFSGGYHTSTYGRCFLLTNSVYLFVLVLGSLVMGRNLTFIIPVITLFSFLIIYAHSPVRNKKHPISEKILRKNRRIARILVTTISISILVLSMNRSIVDYLYYPLFSLAAVAVMIIPTLFGKED